MVPMRHSNLHTAEDPKLSLVEGSDIQHGGLRRVHVILRALTIQKSHQMLQTTHKISEKIRITTNLADSSELCNSS
jgi:hypothetical protein